jgi:uncharacterized protein (TIGR02466 family)
MNLELWFPQPIWFEDYDADFSKSIEYIQQLKATSPGRKISNVGGWQSNDIELEDVEELEETFNIIRKASEHVVGDLQQYGFGEFKLSNAWANVNKGTDFNRQHVHSGVTFSGCLYLKASDKAGDISFVRPDNISLYHGIGVGKSGMFYTSANYKPITGRLLIFPAWLPHMVLPSEDDEERISIAFNLSHEGENA